MRTSTFTCDRCNDAFNPSVDRPVTSVSMIVSGIALEKEAANNLDDLCPKCTLSFLTWLKAEAKE